MLLNFFLLNVSANLLVEGYYQIYIYVSLSVDSLENKGCFCDLRVSFISTQQMSFFMQSTMFLQYIISPYSLLDVPKPHMLHL